jgi:succinate dehydrogenase / fumarate reductase iron-sulfur subunit
MKLTLKVWRQANRTSAGAMVDYTLDGVSEDSSFLEMLDMLNEDLIKADQEPVAFDHDCREGICGMCGLVINGIAHGPERATTTCQLHMRHFKDGDVVYIEPWRARGFPVMKDLIVDRTSLDRIVQAGGFISVNTGAAPDGNAVPVPKPAADRSMDAASCISCGACVAACPNASAMLFTSAKLGHLNSLPQGQPERYDRAILMVEQMDAEGFGGCTNIGECAAVCPKEISLDFIAAMNRDLMKAGFKGAGKRVGADE